MKELLIILVSSAIVNNVVLSQFLGLCPFLGVSKSVETAAGMGGAIIFVITLSSFVTGIIYNAILVPTNLTYLQTIVFILLIAALVQFVEMFLKKTMPSLYQALGVYVKCAGTCEKTKDNYEYTGVEDCEMMAFIPGGGAKSCTYGCLGFGSCVKACPFGAIDVVNGVAVVDKEACKACGKCVAKCPKHLIELVPYEQTTFVQCSSHAKGKAVTSACEVGCIGCKKCEKTCPNGAITVDNFCAHIDYSKCTNCGACKEVCPRHIIQ